MHGILSWNNSTTSYQLEFEIVTSNQSVPSKVSPGSAVYFKRVKTVILKERTKMYPLAERHFNIFFKFSCP
jgi:hypothetical protein